MLGCAYLSTNTVKGSYHNGVLAGMLLMLLFAWNVAQNV